MTLNTSKMIPIEDIASSEVEFADELVPLSHEARRFLETKKWCKRIVKGMFDRGLGRVFGVFLFSIEPIREDIPTQFWVIVGDLPPAYIDVEDNPNGACAIEAYVMEMQKWVDCVRQGKHVREVIPVNVPPEQRYADMLQGRLDFIRKRILPTFKRELKQCAGKVVV